MRVSVALVALALNAPLAVPAGAAQLDDAAAPKRDSNTLLTAPHDDAFSARDHRSAPFRLPPLDAIVHSEVGLLSNTASLPHTVAATSAHGLRAQFGIMPPSPRQSGSWQSTAVQPGDAFAWVDSMLARSTTPAARHASTRSTLFYYDRLGHVPWSRRSRANADWSSHYTTVSFSNSDTFSGLTRTARTGRALGVPSGPHRTERRSSEDTMIYNRNYQPDGPIASLLGVMRAVSLSFRNAISTLFGPGQAVASTSHEH